VKYIWIPLVALTAACSGSPLGPTATAGPTGFGSLASDSGIPAAFVPSANISCPSAMTPDIRVAAQSHNSRISVAWGTNTLAPNVRIRITRRQSTNLYTEVVNLLESTSVGRRELVVPSPTDGKYQVFVAYQFPPSCLPQTFGPEAMREVSFDALPPADEPDGPFNPWNWAPKPVYGWMTSPWSVAPPAA